MKCILSLLAAAATAARAVPPVITAVNTYPSVPEGGQASITFIRTGSTTQALSVGITKSGSAIPNGDYFYPWDLNTTLEQITFQPGQSTVTLTIPVYYDGTVEPLETFAIYATPGTNYTLGAANFSGHWLPLAGVVGGGAQIVENTLPIITAENLSPSVVEGSSTLIRFFRTGPTTAPLSFAFTGGGNATPNADYYWPWLLYATPQEFTFPAGVASVDVVLPTYLDGVSEPIERFGVAAVTYANCGYLLGPANNFPKWGPITGIVGGGVNITDNPQSP